MTSADPRIAALWDEISRLQTDEQARWNTLLRGLGVKMVHPDDGWVDRDRDAVTPAYPEYDEHPEPGDLIALGSPSQGYRIVAVAEVEDRPTYVSRGTRKRYRFVDHGHRLPEPERYTPLHPIRQVRRMLRAV